MVVPLGHIFFFRSSAKADLIVRMRITKIDSSF